MQDHQTGARFTLNFIDTYIAERFTLKFVHIAERFTLIFVNETRDERNDNLNDITGEEGGQW